MRAYKLINNVVGWLVFAVAAFTYLSTIEPTASFWDCGEFIASAYKLEVGHPPGNPIFMMTANLFTQLASDPSNKAMMVNAMSAIFSALTILFLFWTITHLAKKLVSKNDEKNISLAGVISVIGAGVVGALAYTWSDTFWFSAVEGEVYAFSSMMTALVFWLILKWEDVAEEPHSGRWLILIAYLMGISIAVHLLNLLCIPAIVLVYYFKKFEKTSTKGTILALLLSFAIVAVLLFGIIQGLVKVAGWSELLFVNSFGLPYNSGLVFYVVVLFGTLIWGIWESMREKISKNRLNIAFLLGIALLGIPFFGSNPVVGIVLTAIIAAFLFTWKKVNAVILNTIMSGLLVITIGYSSYALILIRSAANTPMDQNSPEDIFTLKTYLSREQYGETPLLYGNTYSSVIIDAKDGDPVWTRVPKTDPSEKDRYFVSMYKQNYIYPSESKMLFPRMYDRLKTQGYKDWANVKGKAVRLKGYNQTIVIPTFAENIRYFFKYQVNYMYWRYFMWNFSGRQNDLQGQGEVSRGNWITGIKFIDSLLVGPQDNMPDSIVNNKGHNKFYMLPLFLGLLGILFQIGAGKKGNQGFWIVFLLFFMTGLAIVLYLNQPPNQPRERDYAYAGSFYAFAIWIGLGTLGIIKLIRQYMKTPKLASSIAGSILCLLVPIQMVSQTWDDHDRSNRAICRDFGRNYLATCEPNAVIFTMGDNDTFPLWYAQEVDTFRTDVRVCNLSYLQTDWYIDQMKRQAYESDPLPISWKYTDYIQGKNEYARIIEQTKEPWEISRALNRVKSDNKLTKTAPVNGQMYEVGENIPTNTLYIPIDRKAAINAGFDNPDSAMVFDISKNLITGTKRSSLSKPEMIIFDMINNNTDWTRPFYYAMTTGPEEYGLLSPYLRRDGVAFRVVPYAAQVDNREADVDILYDNLMHKYRYGNLEQPGLYIDETSSNQANNFRSFFTQLAGYLLKENKTDSVEAVLDYGLKVIPEYNVPFDSRSIEFAQYYDAIGKTEKAETIYNKLLKRAETNLAWYSRLKESDYATVIRDVNEDIHILYRVMEYYEQKDKEKGEELSKKLDFYWNELQQFMNKNKKPTGSNR